MSIANVVYSDLVARATTLEAQNDELATSLASERMHKGALVSRIAVLEKALEWMCSESSCECELVSNKPCGHCRGRAALARTDCEHAYPPSVCPICTAIGVRS